MCDSHLLKWGGEMFAAKMSFSFSDLIFSWLSATQWSCSLLPHLNILNISNIWITEKPVTICFEHICYCSIIKSRLFIDKIILFWHLSWTFFLWGSGFLGKTNIDGVEILSLQVLSNVFFLISFLFLFIFDLIELLLLLL